MFTPVMSLGDVDGPAGVAVSDAERTGGDHVVVA